LLIDVKVTKPQNHSVKHFHSSLALINLWLKRRDEKLLERFMVTALLLYMITTITSRSVWIWNADGSNLKNLRTTGRRKFDTVHTILRRLPFSTRQQHLENSAADVPTDLSK